MGDPDVYSRSRLDPRALARGGEAGGDRIEGSRLAARRGWFLDAYWLGSDGKGGTSTGSEGEAPELVDGRFGDGSRNVLAVIELELFDLRSVGPPTLTERRPCIGPDGDCVEDRRWTIRFVCTFSTLVGVGVRFRNAAAAAAEERLLEEG